MKFRKCTIVVTIIMGLVTISCSTAPDGGAEVSEESSLDAVLADGPLELPDQAPFDEQLLDYAEQERLR